MLINTNDGKSNQIIPLETAGMLNSDASQTLVERVKKVVPCILGPFSSTSLEIKMLRIAKDHTIALPGGGNSYIFSYFQPEDWGKKITHFDGRILVKGVGSTTKQFDSGPDFQPC